jgi:hypothetical protein
MTVCADEATEWVNDAYWMDNGAAEPVLLVDEAADAITEALHRVRAGSVLEDRDLAAAGVALRDLLGGLGELADLLSTSADKYVENGPLEVGQLEDQLEILRTITQHAQQTAEKVQLLSMAIRMDS